MRKEYSKYEKLVIIMDESNDSVVKKQINSLIAVCVDYWTVYCKYQNIKKEVDYLESQSTDNNVPEAKFRMFARIYYEMLQYMNSEDLKDSDYLRINTFIGQRKKKILDQIDRYCKKRKIDIEESEKETFLSELNKSNINSYYKERYLSTYLAYISNFKEIYVTIESFYDKISIIPDVSPEEAVEEILRDEFVNQLWLEHLNKGINSDIRLNFSIVPVRRALWNKDPSNMTKPNRNDHFLTANCRFSRKVLAEKLEKRINRAKDIADEYIEARDEDRKWRKMLKLPERSYD